MQVRRQQRTEDVGMVESVGLLLLGMLLFWPRLVIFGFAIVNSDLFRNAFGGWVVPALGFIVLPWTTLAYASMWSISSDQVTGLEWIVVGIAVLMDVWTWSAFRR